MDQSNEEKLDAPPEQVVPGATAEHVVRRESSNAEELAASASEESTAVVGGMRELGCKTTRIACNNPEYTYVSSDESEEDLGDEDAQPAAPKANKRKRKPRHQPRSVRRARSRAAAKLAAQQNEEATAGAPEKVDGANERDQPASSTNSSVPHREAAPAATDVAQGNQRKKARVERSSTNVTGEVCDAKLAARNNEEATAVAVKPAGKPQVDNRSLHIVDISSLGGEAALAFDGPPSNSSSPPVPRNGMTPKMPLVQRNKIELEAIRKAAQDAVGMRVTHIKLPLAQRLQPFDGGLLVVCHNIRGGNVNLSKTYKDLIKSGPRPHVLAFQEVRKLQKPMVEIFKKLGYTVAAKCLNPTEARGGVVLFVDSTRVSFSPIEVEFPEPSYSQCEVCAARVMLKKDEKRQAVGVCSAYMRNDGDAEERADSASVLEPIFKILHDAGVDLVAGNLNCARHTWSPFVTTEVNHCLSDDPTRWRGARLLSMTLQSSWGHANNASATPPPRLDDNVPMAADLATHKGHRPRSFAVNAGGEGQHLRDATRPGTTRDNPFIDAQTTSDVPVVRTIKFRCPQLRLSAIKDWNVVLRTCNRLAKGKYQKRPTESAPAKEHFRMMWDMFADLVRTLPQPKRQIKVRTRTLNAEAISPGEDAAIATENEDEDAHDLVGVFEEDSDEFIVAEFVLAASRFTNPREDDVARREEATQTCADKTHVQPCLRSEDGIPMPVRTQAREFATFFKTKTDRCKTEAAEAYSAWLTAENERLRPPSDQPAAWNEDEDRVTVAELKLAISRLRIEQSGDPQGLKPLLLKHLPEEWYDRLAVMMTAMLREGFVPREWRLAVAVPAFEGGGKDPGLATSYQAIAITDLLCRIMEIIVLNRIEQHDGSLKRIALPFQEQHSNLECGPSTDKLAETTVSDVAESGTPVHNRRESKEMKISDPISHCSLQMSVDFTDAFCRVTPEKVEWVLRQTQVPEFLIRWVCAFMTGRRQKMAMNNRMSKPTPCEVGCPQGSAISPFLLSLVVDDLLKELGTLKASLDVVHLSEADSVPGTESVGIRSKLCEAYNAFTSEEGSTLELPFNSRAQLLTPMVDFAANVDGLTVEVSGQTPRLTAAGALLMLSCITDWADRNGFTVDAKTQNN